MGVYWWKKGSDYVKYAEQMIEKNIRTNGEFYVCPVFNEAIEDDKRVRIKEIDKMVCGVLELQRILITSSKIMKETFNESCFVIVWSTKKR